MQTLLCTRWDSYGFLGSSIPVSDKENTHVSLLNANVATIPYPRLEDQRVRQHCLDCLHTADSCHLEYLRAV